uniref:Uncharacterized protein n=1 Tax=Cucumis melo TaxID=3656 RepID=A0A9I9E4W4_CUCME
MTKTMGVSGEPHYIVGLVNVGCTGRALHHADRSFIRLKVEIELPVLDTLPTSAESSGSNSSTWLELHFESVHVEMLFYKSSDVRAAFYLCEMLEYLIAHTENLAEMVRRDEI